LEEGKRKTLKKRNEEEKIVTTIENKTKQNKTKSEAKN
jgi:hypothetical protein